MKQLPLHNDVDAFDLAPGYPEIYPGITSNETKLIVLEDLTGKPLAFPYVFFHNDQDYDDAYWVVEVTEYEMPDYVPPGGGCNCGCGCASDTTTAPNVSPTNDACSISAPGGLRYDSRTAENNSIPGTRTDNGRIGRIPRGE